MTSFVHLLSAIFLVFLRHNSRAFIHRTVINHARLHTKLSGAVTNRMLNQTQDLASGAEFGFQDVDDVFPPSDDNEYYSYRTSVDITELEPSDPRFLDFPWPDKAGPESSAFAKHLQWKRSLSDGERMRWQKWAVYQRLGKKDKFDYSLEDYVYQTMLRDITKKCNDALKQDNIAEAKLWEAVATGYKKDEEGQVRATIKSFYSALNRQNFDDMRSLWLPDENAELVVPGYEKQVGMQ